MKVENTKFVAVNYTLTVDGQIADQNPEGQPLEFVCGAGMLLPKFEGALIGKEPGDKVSFTLEPKDGYGELIPEAIVELPKTIFMIDGKVVEEMLFVGNVVPMSDAEGHRMNGIIKEVKDETVMMDFNHPMAGKTLNFDVEVVEVRDVTPEDLAPKGGCSCGCDHDHCGDGCEGCGEDQPELPPLPSTSPRFSPVREEPSARLQMLQALPKSPSETDTKSLQNSSTLRLFYNPLFFQNL